MNKPFKCKTLVLCKQEENIFEIALTMLTKEDTTL